MNIKSEKTIVASGLFIIALMTLDATLSGDVTRVPRTAVGGLMLIFMLSSLSFVGLGGIAGPFAALVAGTVFLSRGGRVYTRLAELSETEEEPSGGSSIYGQPPLPPRGLPRTQGG